jgi:hypothetical protein
MTHPRDKERAPVYERPALAKHQKAVADAVVAALEPILAEMDRKLDMLLAQLGAAETAIRETARRIDLADEIDRHARDES